jgi:hypothetical protein
MVAQMVVVTMHPLVSDGSARKADRQCDRIEKAFEHGYQCSAWRNCARLPM